MKNTIRVDVCSRYNPDRKTYILAKTHTNESGRTFAVISRRQLQAAEKRVCYAGTDGLRFMPLAGFSDFIETYSRAWHALQYRKRSAILPLYIVNADRVTGEWIGEAQHVGEVSRAEWDAMSDTDSAHFDTYESDGQTRAVEVVWLD